jgi:hypothetical protein
MCCFRVMTLPRGRRQRHPPDGQANPGGGLSGSQQTPLPRSIAPRSFKLVGASRWGTQAVLPPRQARRGQRL